MAQEAADREAMHRELEKVRGHLYEVFHLEQLLDKHIILLSSGELRKFQLTKTLLTNPRVLIMDNPFIGLDVTARGQLAEFLTLLTRETNVSVVLVLSKTDDVPDFITHVVEVKDLKVGEKMTLREFKESREPVPARMLSEEKERARCFDTCGFPHRHRLPEREHPLWRADDSEGFVVYGEGRGALGAER